MIFSVYSVKMLFLFPTNMMHLSVKKVAMMTFPVSFKKMIFILENMVFLLIEKLNMTKKFTFIKKFL